MPAWKGKERGGGPGSSRPVHVTRIDGGIRSGMETDGQENRCVGVGLATRNIRLWELGHAWGADLEGKGARADSVTRRCSVDCL